MDAASGSASVCASTGASRTTIGTSIGTVPTSAPPNDNVLVAYEPETTAVVGGVDAENSTAEVEPALKKQKKCTSKVWEHYTKYSVTAKTTCGGEEKQVWAKYKKSPHKARAKTSRGTKALWNHLEFKHAVKQGQQQLQLEKGEGEGNCATVQTYRMRG